MSYKQWSVLYRPKTLDEVVLSDDARSLITSMVKNNRTHAMLIHGQSGAGKTTLARIMARSMASVEDNVTSPDVVERNLGDSRGIDDIRQLVSASRFLPSKKGAKRVFILDEAHALTGNAMSALLKPLEEPEEHCIWILITDQPEKLNRAALNRCQSIKIDLPTTPQLAGYLMRILKREKALTNRTVKDKKRLCKACAEAAANVPRASVQLLQSAVDVEESFKTIKDLIAGPVMGSPEVEINRAAAKVIVALLLAQQGNDTLGPMVKALTVQSAVPMLNRLLFTLQATIVEQASGVPQNGTYFFQEAVKKVGIESIDLNLMTDIFDKLVDARSKIADFSATPESLLLIGVLNAYKAASRKGKK